MKTKMKMMNNKVILKGIFSTDYFNYEYNFNNEAFYSSYFRIDRSSGSADIVRVILSDKFLSMNVDFNRHVTLIGELRTRNCKDSGKSKLDIYVFVQDICQANDNEYDNVVTLTGYICKTPIIRDTPMGRTITDVLIAVNRYYNRSDYIPCIAWSRNARFIKNLQIGTKVSVSGRLQSREYTKQLDDDTYKTFTAYEMSISSIEVISEDTGDESNT